MRWMPLLTAGLEKGRSVVIRDDGTGAEGSKQSFPAKQGLGLHILELFTATQEEPLSRAVNSTRISYSIIT